jgi:hypothetical protein
METTDMAQEPDWPKENDTSASGSGNSSPQPSGNNPPPQSTAGGPASSAGGNSPAPTGTNPSPNAGGSGGNSPPTTGGGNPPSGGGESGMIIGAGGVLQPLVEVVNQAVTETSSELQQVGEKSGLGGMTGELIDVVESTGLGSIGAAAGPDGNSNLVTDVVKAPGDVLNGDTEGVIANVSNDLADILTQSFELKDEAVLDGSDPLNVVPGLIESVGSGLQTLPIVSIGGGNGLVGGSAGDLTHSPSGHLIDVGLGPTSANGLSLNVLSTPGSGAGPALGVSVLDVGSNGPNLLDLHLLGGELPLTGGLGNGGLLGNLLPQPGGEGGGLLGGVIDVPGLGGFGADGLVGGVLDTLTPSSGGGAPLPALPQAGIVGEIVAEVAFALDLGDTEHNHGLLGLVA